MSIHVMNNVWRGSGSEGSELLLLLALADWADEFGFCHPSLPMLAKKTRLSERTVQRLLAKLCDRGELQKEHGAGMTFQTAQGARTTNLYRILWGDKMTTEPSSGVKSGGVRATNGASSGDIALSGCTKEEPSKKNRQDLLEVRPTFPPPLNTQEIEWAWEDWLRVMKEKRTVPTESEKRLQMLHLIKMGPEKALLALQNGARCGWKGLYEPKRNETNNAKRYPTGNTGTANEGRAAQYAGVGKVL